ncbi:hypothetical protein WA026_008336 [Henosepilachna vigintioctopunctata]|uniref:Uncharacterized protein n=1 Tax=Henosepilachna vigintioctopunctata TaxID=420089 RepID=A0AAW1UB01_9CUCU
MVSVPASPPESKSRKEPTACIAKNQESTVREEASTSCATPKSSFGSKSTEKCSPIHEINAAKLYVKKLQLLVRYLNRVLVHRPKNAQQFMKSMQQKLDLCFS